MKLIVIGASLTGKTTLVRYLRSISKQPVSEMDEELTNINGGQFPLDTKIKHQVLAPKIINKILLSDNIIFFTNTDYFAVCDIKKAKENGFKIVQLETSLEELLIRNNSRMKNEGYDDLSQWLPGMIEYQQTIKNNGLVDMIIDAKQSTEEIVKEIVEVRN
ncbi:MAG TPA: hypothetical protein PK639_02580 [Candidatus Woesebacteria bacterium]|nr:hypothetical protein [Candidatus Woesebacteria bacterium]